jgi:hypothetical protein
MKLRIYLETQSETSWQRQDYLYLGEASLPLDFLFIGILLTAVLYLSTDHHHGAVFLVALYSLAVRPSASPACSTAMRSAAAALAVCASTWLAILEVRLLDVDGRSLSTYLDAKVLTANDLCIRQPMSVYLR